jgi:hypothetical protein
MEIGVWRPCSATSLPRRPISGTIARRWPGSGECRFNPAVAVFGPFTPLLAAFLMRAAGNRVDEIATPGGLLITLRARAK